MIQTLDLFSPAVPEGFTQSPPPPKGVKRCGRDPEAGPGTCYNSWDGCPADSANCFMRWLSANYDAVKHLPVEEQNLIARNAERYGWQK